MILKIQVKNLQIICQKSSALAQKSDKKSPTYDKIKNGCGLLGHPLSTELKKNNKLLNLSGYNPL